MEKKNSEVSVNKSAVMALSRKQLENLFSVSQHIALWTLYTMKWLTYESNQVSNDNLIKSITWRLFFVEWKFKIVALGD